jgi:protein-tyrosine phosphatase
LSRPTGKAFTKDQNNPVNSKIKLILSYSKNFQLDEVPDPYYGNQNGFEKVIDLLDDAMDGLIDSLTD